MKLNDKLREAYMAGFFAGFRCTDKGYNAEYPFHDKGVKPEEDRDLRLESEFCFDGFMERNMR